MLRRPSPVAEATWESLGICPVDKEQDFRDGSDNEHDSKANFRRAGRKRHLSVTPTNIGVSLGEEFFDHTESYSIESAYLDEAVLFDFHSPVSFYKR